MQWTNRQLDEIEIHFLLCTERTGSSLLSLMLNLNEEILCPSEEPFALYLFKAFGKLEVWTEKDILHFSDSVYELLEKNRELYFSPKGTFIKCLREHSEILNFERAVKLTYLHFLDLKDKTNVKVIVDKQIKYFFHLKEIQEIFPSSRFMVLVRDVRDNIVSKQNRQLNWNQNPAFLAHLWQDTYAQCTHLKKPFLTLKYEDFVQNPRQTLMTICEFINVEFQPEMLNTEGVFENLLEQKKHLLDPEFLKHIRDFHKGLSQQPNANKIGQYKQLPTKTLKLVETICQKELSIFGYQIQSSIAVKPKLSFYRVMALLYRRYLLHFYFAIPLFIKLLIKRTRKRREQV